MRNDRWIQIGCAVAAVCIIGGGSMLAKAGETLDVESAVAGVAVPLNNYYASSLNPEAELTAFLNSDEIMRLGTSSEETMPAEETSAEETTAEETSAEETSTEETSSEETTAEETTAEETTAEQTTEAETEAPTEPETEAPKVSPYADIAVSHVRENSYVNIRTEPNTTSEKVGKLYNDCAATILNTVEGEDGLWYEIKSGSVQGYIKAEYFLTGDEAEARAIEIGKLEGRVNTNGLRLRTEPNLESSILTLLYSGEKYIVVEEGEEWVKVMVDDLEGYVFREMIDISLKFDTAISLEEERQQKEEEERKKREAEEAQRRLEEAKRQEEEAQRQEQENNNSSNNGGSSSGSSSSVTSASRDALVAYAQQWVGVTPYVWGGTSLQSGADCSGFVQAIYKNVLGMSIPRTSRQQAEGGTVISEGELQPGDLVFYNSGGNSEINHVAMYIGGGKVVHASNAKLDTIISNMKYREPCKYVRYVN